MLEMDISELRAADVLAAVSYDRDVVNVAHGSVDD